jgi:hypothetical protein
VKKKEVLMGYFFIVGNVILLLCVVLWFIPYYTIELRNNALHLISSRKKEVSLPLNAITHAEIGIYNRYHLNNPVFNVLNKEEYRFYSEGRKALLLKLEGGNLFRIGMKSPEILFTEIKKSIP